MMAPLRPVLRWHGGKWNLAPWIIEHLPPHRIYCEPFGGAGSVLMRKPRSYAEIWNDLDQSVVNLFRVLQEDLSAKLVHLLRVTPFSREEYRRAFEESDCPIESARRLIIRSFMGFGSNAHNIKLKSGFRSNANRSGTTPAHDWINYPDALVFVIERLRGVVVENRDALDLIAQHDSPNTLFYVDPPYVLSTRSDTAQDYACELEDADHERLLNLLQSIAGMAVVSGYPCDLYDHMLSGWHRFERKAFADGARPRTEVLWLNASAQKGLSNTSAQSDMFGGKA